MGITCEKRIEWDAGHRLAKHEGRCRHAHGHRYAAVIKCRAAKLDEVGRVVDFSVIKEKVGGWIDEYWDHGFLVEAGDPLQAVLYADRSKVYQMPDAPTAENIARHLFGIANQLLRPSGVEVTEIMVYETPTSSATYTAQD